MLHLQPDMKRPREDIPQRKTHNKKQPLSCAECRRLKLKCDRVFPCQSCSKRGCAEICPDGALTSGKGSRFILANTEQLHAKIIQMSDRIRQLEDALASSQHNTIHPLLQQDLLRIKNSLELYSPHGSANATAADHHPTASSSRHPPSRLSEDRGSSTDVGTSDVPRLSPEIEKLSQSFPYLLLPDNPMRERIYDMLPPRQEAEYLCTQARLNALWQYNLDPSETWLPNLVHHVYTTPVHDLSFRRLSLLFIMMAIGLLVDLQQPRQSPRAEVYHRLARASLCETNLMDEPSLDLIQTLFYMIWYLLIFSDKSQAVAYAWSTMGLTVKLAQSLGLHRDCNRWKVIPEESQRRRMLFWELLNLDARLALSLGRPPSINLDHVDCRQPSYAVPGMYIVPGVQSYHEWKHSFFIHCLTPVLTAAISAHPQPYRNILAVDSAIRNFPVPPTLDIFHASTTGNTNRQLTMQQVLVSSGREIVLLQLHRNFFTEALSDYDAFSYTHKFAPSAVATCLSASRLISTLRTLEAREPALSRRFMCFWFNAFSGAVALSLVVSRTPFLSIAKWALKELGEVHGLFGRVAIECGEVARALPLLTKIAERARRSYITWKRAADECVGTTTMMDVDDEMVKPSTNAGTNANTSTSSSPSTPPPPSPPPNSNSNSNTTTNSNSNTTSPSPSSSSSSSKPIPPSFEDVHPDLLRCLEHVNGMRMGVGDVPLFEVRGVQHAHSHTPHTQGHTHAQGHAQHTQGQDVSTDMLALVLGRGGEEYLRGGRCADASSDACAPNVDGTGEDNPNPNANPNASAGTGGGQRGVGHHAETFNFDFGALASNVENQSNTYMSWF